MKIYAIHSEEMTALDIDKWSRKITSTRIKDKIKKLKCVADKKRTLLGELLVRYAMTLEKQILELELFFDVHEKGKPYCRNNPRIHFNISHSGSWVVCAVSDRPIGIDIERIGSADMLIAQRVYTKQEYQYLQRQKNWAEVFYKIWTLKESYIKYTGQGLTVPLNSFEFDFDDEKIRLRNNEKLFFLSGKVFENYYMSICSEEQGIEMSPQIITLEELQAFSWPDMTKDESCEVVL